MNGPLEAKIPRLSLSGQVERTSDRNSWYSSRVLATRPRRGELPVPMFLSLCNALSVNVIVSFKYFQYFGRNRRILGAVLHEVLRDSKTTFGFIARIPRSNA